MYFLLLFGLGNEPVLEKLRDDPPERVIADVRIASVKLIKSDQWMATDVSVDLDCAFGQFEVWRLCWSDIALGVGGLHKVGLLN